MRSAYLPRWTVLPLLGIALWLALFWRGPLINDVAWQMWIAERLNGGAELYVDIFEINPPLWFWIGAVVERVARAIGVGAVEGLTLFFATAALASLAACLRLLERDGERLRAGAALLLFLFVSSLYALGQREQFAFLAAAPFVLLKAKRASGASVPMGLAGAIGAFAACGLLLKPYFLLVPLVLEVWLLLRERRWRLRPETLVLAAATLLYGAAILLVTPAYLTTMVPLIRAAYQDFGLELYAVLLAPALLGPLLGLLGILLAGRAARTPEVSASMLAAGAFAAAGLWQAKGFAYHFLPALGFTLLGLALALPAVWHARAIAKAAALLSLFLAGATAAREVPRGDAAAEAATAGLPQGATVLMLSASGSAAWPLIQERGYAWPSRHMTYWMMVAVWRAEEEGRADPELQRIGRAIVAEAAADIERSRPAMLLFDRRYDGAAAGGIVGYFTADPRFARAMASYRRVPDVGQLAVYRRIGS